MFDHPWVLVVVLVIGWCVVVAYLVRVLVARVRRGSLDVPSEQREDLGARLLAWRVGKGS